MRMGLKMAMSYRKSVLQEMMAHAHRVLGMLPEDDPDRGKWSSFYCGCEDMLQLMAEAEMIAEYREGIVDIMERHGLKDWTIAAQSYAMAAGKDERVVMSMVREEFEG